MKKTDKREKNDKGYALVGIMGVMMFALILTTAAAPKLKFESQREKEEEMLWRGQQIARAISQYARDRGGMVFPKDLKKELVEGVTLGASIKKKRYLRPSALCDPMMHCTSGESNWRTVHPGDPLVKELLEAYQETQRKGQMIIPNPPATLMLFATMGGAQLPGDLGLGGSNSLPGAPPGAPPAGGSGADDSSGSGGGDKSDDKLKGPIIGVVSRKSDKMFRNYFGIDQYDHTLFFPDVLVMVSGFINPLILAGAVSSPSGPDTRCPDGGVYIDGKCWGAPSKICRDPVTGNQAPCPGQPSR